MAGFSPAASVQLLIELLEGTPDLVSSATADGRILMAPMIARGEVVGSLWLTAVRAERHFNAGDVTLAAELAQGGRARGGQRAAVRGRPARPAGSRRCAGHRRARPPQPGGHHLHGVGAPRGALPGLRVRGAEAGRDHRALGAARQPADPGSAGRPPRRSRTAGRGAGPSCRGGAGGRCMGGPSSAGRRGARLPAPRGRTRPPRRPRRP